MERHAAPTPLRLTRAMALAGVVAAVVGCGAGNRSGARTTGFTSTIAGETVRSDNQATSSHNAHPPARVQALASTVCSAVRDGAPPFPAGRLNDKQFRQYATVTEIYARRTAISLQRLGQQNQVEAPLRPLVTDYQALANQLRALTSSRGHGRLSASAVDLVRVTNDRIRQDAAAARLPQCAPQG